MVCFNKYLSFIKGVRFSHPRKYFNGRPKKGPSYDMQAAHASVLRNIRKSKKNAKNSKRMPKTSHISFSLPNVKKEPNLNKENTVVQALYDQEEDSYVDFGENINDENENVICMEEVHENGVGVSDKILEFKVEAYFNEQKEVAYLKANISMEQYEETKTDTKKFEKLCNNLKDLLSTKFKKKHGANHVLDKFSILRVIRRSKKKNERAEDFMTGYQPFVKSGACNISLRMYMLKKHMSYKCPPKEEVEEISEREALSVKLIPISVGGRYKYIQADIEDDNDDVPSLPSTETSSQEESFVYRAHNCNWNSRTAFSSGYGSYRKELNETKVNRHMVRDFETTQQIIRSNQSINASKDEINPTVNVRKTYTLDESVESTYTPKPTKSRTVKTSSVKIKQETDESPIIEEPPIIEEALETEESSKMNDSFENRYCKQYPVRKRRSQFEDESLNNSVMSESDPFQHVESDRENDIVSPGRQSFDVSTMLDNNLASIKKDCPISVNANTDDNLVHLAIPKTEIDLTTFGDISAKFEDGVRIDYPSSIDASDHSCIDVKPSQHRQTADISYLGSSLTDMYDFTASPFNDDCDDTDFSMPSSPLSTAADQSSVFIDDAIGRREDEDAAAAPGLFCDWPTTKEDYSTYPDVDVKYSKREQNIEDDFSDGFSHSPKLIASAVDFDYEDPTDYYGEPEEDTTNPTVLYSNVTPQYITPNSPYVNYNMPPAEQNRAPPPIMLPDHSSSFIKARQIDGSEIILSKDTLFTLINDDGSHTNSSPLLFQKPNIGITLSATPVITSNQGFSNPSYAQGIQSPMMINPIPTSDPLSQRYPQHTLAATQNRLSTPLPLLSGRSSVHSPHLNSYVEQKPSLPLLMQEPENLSSTRGFTNNLVSLFYFFRNYIQYFSKG